MSPEPVIGVDAGGTKLLAAALVGDWEVQHRVFRRWDGRDRDQVLATMVEAVEEVRAAAPDAVAVGLGIPSLVDFESGTSVACVHLPLEGVPVRDVMATRLGLPVHVDNDVNLALLGEVRGGAASGARNAVMLTLGTGVGGALWVDGGMRRGADGAAGELGHMTVDLDGPPCQGNCPNRGCLEALVSGPAIAREGDRVAAARPGSALERARSDGAPITGELVTDHALAGDSDAREVIARVGERLGAGLVGIVNAFNPEVVVIGGGVSRAGDLLLEPARQVVRERALRPSGATARIELARFGDEAGVIGAGLFARAGGKP